MPQGHGTQSRNHIEAEHEKDKHRQKPAHVGKEQCMEHVEYDLLIIQKWFHRAFQGVLISQAGVLWYFISLEYMLVS